MPPLKADRANPTRSRLHGLSRPDVQDRQSGRTGQPSVPASLHWWPAVLYVSSTRLLHQPGAPSEVD